MAGELGGAMARARSFLAPTFAQRAIADERSADEFPAEGLTSQVARQLVRDERSADANPKRNLASFVTTWMEEEAVELMQEALDVNAVDEDEYPSIRKFENRCVAMLADLFHAPEEGRGSKAAGAATVGSSEAIFLGGLAMKIKWEERQAKKRDQPGADAGKPRGTPNLIMAGNVQVCWEKFCAYFDVEPRYVPNDADHLCLNVERALGMIDENTIGVCGILGSTYTGHFEDIAALDAGVEALKSKGLEVPVHVDGASGAFIAPFAFPDLQWDFKLKNVVSINASGHKYGLVYPGIGWIVWRDWSMVPKKLIFTTNYLGADLPSITINFSKGASQIVGQYYQFLRLGREGYTAIMSNLQRTKTYLTEKIEGTGCLKILSADVGVPLVAFCLKAPEDGGRRSFDEFDLADKLRERGWVVPAYSMPKDIKEMKLLRVVIREDMSHSLAGQLVEDIKWALAYLETHFSFSKKDLEAHDEQVIDAVEAAKGLRWRNFAEKFSVHRTESQIIKRMKHNGVC